MLTNYSDSRPFDAMETTHSSIVTTDRKLSEMEVLNAYSTMMSVDKFVAVTIDVIGLIFNPLSAYFWLDWRIRTKNSSAIYLGLLSVTHFLFLLLGEFTQTIGMSCLARKWVRLALPGLFLIRF